MSDIASTSTSTEIEALTLATKIKKYDTNALIEFLKDEGFPLKKKDFETIATKEITGQKFLKLNKQMLREYGMEDVTATKLVIFIDFINDEKMIPSHEIMEFVKNELNLNEEQMTKFKEKVQELEKNCETGMSIKIRNSRREKSALHPLDIESESETISSLDRSIEMVLMANHLSENVDFTETNLRTTEDDDDDDDDNEYPIEGTTRNFTRNQENRIGEIINAIDEMVPEKKHWCVICRNGYVYESGLKRHLRNKH